MEELTVQQYNRSTTGEDSILWKENNEKNYLINLNTSEYKPSNYYMT